ncbi:MAG: hypothetical protein ACRDCG_00955, partial [Mycoplasmoidaceae bacterium]
MKKNRYVKWFFLVSTTLGSLTSFTIYNSLKRVNSKSIKIDYNKVTSFINDKKIKRSFFSDGINNNSSFDQKFNQQINLFKKKNFNLNDIQKYANKQKKQLKGSNIDNNHKYGVNISPKDKSFLKNSQNFIGKMPYGIGKLSSSDGTWDNYVDKTWTDWTKMAKALSDIEIAAITTAVVVTAAAAAYLALAVFSFGATIPEAVQCFTMAAQLSLVAISVASVSAAMNAVLVYDNDSRYAALEKVQTILISLLVPLASVFGIVSVALSEFFCVCPVVLVVVGMVAGAGVLIVKLQHDIDEKNNYFEFNNVHYNKGDVSQYGLKINDKNDIELNILAKHQYSIKENIKTGIADLNELEQIIPKVPHNNMFKFHGRWFDTDEVNYYSVDVTNDKNTTFVLNDEGIYRFDENIAQANQDYDYLQSILPNDGKGINFGFHGQSFDATRINSFDVQVTDNKNTTLTIDDGKKHQFSQSLNDSTKDYDFLESIMLARGQGENFNFHKQTFNIRNVNSFDLSIINNKNTSLTINDGQKHQFNESLAEANQDYDYLLSIMPNLAQGEIFKFHDQSFDLRKVNSFDVQVTDNKNTVLTIDDGQKHQFNQNLTDSNQDYDYL